MEIEKHVEVLAPAVAKRAGGGYAECAGQCEGVAKVRFVAREGGLLLVRAGGGGDHRADERVERCVSWIYMFH